MPDSKYFHTSNRGEIFELKQQLNAKSTKSKRDALKQVIAAMTVGKDVSSLFTDVLNCMQTVDLELKKLVYLYLINYSKSQPELAILAVNTFVKDASDPNPLIRSLALRTMGCIQVSRISEYLCEPLRKALKDSDPYVRKTAAVCVAKLYEVDPSLVSEYGFIGSLKDLILDSSPMVVANALVALNEIDDSLPGTLELKPNLVSGLLQCLNDCSEWGQVFIIDTISGYIPSGEQEAENMIERILPRLQHANPAVVLSSIKLIIKNLKYIQSTEFSRMVRKKLGAPLVTLVSTEPEVQYVALRNINLLVRKYPEILQEEFKAFFCKYNDPPYIKEEKLEILVRLANEGNAIKIVQECKEYATEVDVGFVRSSIDAIGRIALGIESVANKCVETLIDLVRSKVTYVVQESIVVMKDIMRKYPNQYESVIAVLCDHLEALDDPSARASLVWIIGEYADRIENVTELVESFLENFAEESVQVQLQLLTCAVKVYFKCSGACETILHRVLKDGMQNSDNADLRDRAFFYARLLQLNEDIAKQVVFSKKPRIVENIYEMDASLLQTLLDDMGSLASVYHCSPNRLHAASKPLPQVSVVDEDWNEQEALPDDLLGLSLSDKKESNPSISSPMDEFFGSVSNKTAPSRPIEKDNLLSLIDDLFSGSSMEKSMSGVTSSPNEASSSSDRKLRLLMPSAKAKGLQISGTFYRTPDNRVQYKLELSNHSTITLKEHAIQWNKNLLGLMPMHANLNIHELDGGESITSNVELKVLESEKDNRKGLVFQMALKNEPNGVIYFADKLDETNLIVFLQEENIGKLQKSNFLNEWQRIASQGEYQTSIVLQNKVSLPFYFIQQLETRRIFLVATTSKMSYFSASLMGGIIVLVELNWSETESTNRAQLSIRCNNISELNMIVGKYIEQVFK
eukprot:jgi/Galph1/1608/GphlegSOOS_G278.1